MEKNNINIDLNAKTKSKEERNVPNLRFNKYHNEYELLQLNKTLKIKSGKDQKQVQIEDGQYNIYGTGGIIGKTNTFLYDKPSVGIGRKGTIDKPVYFDKPFWTVDTLFYSEINNGFVPKYIYYTFQTINWRKYNTSTGVPSLTSSSIEHIEKSFPCYDEQLEIASFLTLIDNRISTQIKIIEDLVLQKKLITANIFTSMESLVWNKLSSLEKDEIITLKRGNIIPKHIYDTEYCYPVYSSSIHNNGLMGYSNSFMFNKELVTWSIDGGGNFFYRNKHKFNVTNVSGILELNQNLYDYYFVAEILEYQHSKFIFDYQTKAHPSVIGKMYSLPEVSLDEQKRIVNILKKFNRKLQTERDLLTYYKKQKAYLLKNMFI